MVPAGTPLTAVLLLAKAPRPGVVKTRLAEAIGPEAAAAVYRSLGRAVVQRVGAQFPLTVWYEPRGAVEEMRAWLGDWEYQPQPGGDLGERLRHSVAVHFERGDRPVVAIGADAPGVDVSIVSDAITALRSADVVLGPAVDGGYYLIGLNRDVPGVFDGITWGGPTVLDETLTNLGRAHASVALLPVLRDVDTVDDMHALGIQCP